MRQPGAGGRTARAMERVIARAARKPSPATTWRASGQTLIIFVLLFTALVGFMGLAIDSVRVYDLYARMQRAAEAGALAGVIYMPDHYLANIQQPPYDNAVCRALQETAKNQFGTYCDPIIQPSNLNTLCPADKSTVEVAICPVGGLPHDLRVYITESINVIFLSALGVGPIKLTASAQAEYIPPVDVALDPVFGTGGTGSWGTFGECSGASSACTGNGTRNWAGNINGPGELKEQGDPLVTCEEGPSGLNPALTYGSTDTNAASSLPYTTFAGMPTNHLQNGVPVPGTVPAGCTNPDATNSFTGPIYHGSSVQAPGYAFYVNIPTGAADQSLWVWNAPFSPTSPNSCNGRTGGNNQASYDTFYYYNCSGSSSSSYPFYPNTNCYATSPVPNGSPYTCTDARLFFSVTYSIYSISSTADPAGTLVASFTAWPYEVNDHGCNYWLPTPTAAVYSNYMSANGITPGCQTSSNPTCVTKWCPVNDQIGDVGASTPSIKLSAGQYRVMVVASDYGDPLNRNVGYGGHAYSFKLCPFAGTTQASVQTCTPAANAVVTGWTLSDALFSFPGNGTGSSQITEYPLGYVGPEFAGRTLDIQFYDMGDLSGTNSSAKGKTVYAVSPPTAASDPCTVTTAQLNAAGFPSSAFVFPYNQRTNSTSFKSLTGLQGSSNGDLIYNGLWTDIQITVPSSYTGGSWTVCALAPQTNDGDVLAMNVEALGSSPVHLV